MALQAAARSWAGTPPGGNALLDYLKSLDSLALAQLTSCAGDDIIEAMNAFIHRLLGCARMLRISAFPQACAPSSVAGRSRPHRLQSQRRA